MPYYRWRGIDLEGKDAYGTLFARSYEQLDKELLLQDIAVIAATESLQLTKRSVKRPHLVALCEYMNTLLSAGLRLDEALELCSKTVRSELLSLILKDCAQAIRDGVPLHKIFEGHAPALDMLIISLIKAGEESGSLAATFKTLETHYKAQEELAQKLRSSLMLPLLTLFFFSILTIGIFISVIPRFEALFTMLNKPIPAATQFLFNVSGFFCRMTLFSASAFAVLTILIMYVSCKNPRLNGFRDKIALTTPLVGTIYRFYSLTLFLQTLAALLDGGIHLPDAIRLSGSGIKSVAMQNSLDRVLYDVERGVPLSVAFSSSPLLHTREIEAFCTLGEETGTLAGMIHKAARLYHEKTYSLLAIVTVLIPPALLLLLGGLIGMLIFAVYTPLLTLSRVIG